MIYLDNAATTLQKPPSVIDAVIQAMTSMGNASRGTHASSLEASRIVYQARVRLARLFGCARADHVVFTANSTQALNTVITGLIRPGDHVITTDLEHNSVLRPLYRLKREAAVKLSFVRSDTKGRLYMDDFRRLIRPSTSAIISTHASNLTGNLVDLATIGAIAREAGIPFVVDASQTAGIFPIHMQEMGIDALCFTGHKGLMGPQGTGGLCLREGLKLRPLLVGGTGVNSYEEGQPDSMPARLEAGTLNTHGIAGLAAGVDFIETTGQTVIREHEQRLMRQFVAGLKDIPGVRIYGDFSDRERAAIVALNLADLDSGEVSDELAQRYEIATRPGAHCAPRLHRALGTDRTGAVRFSFSWYNTETEVRRALEALKEISESMRN